MLRQIQDVTHEREETLALALRGVATELRLIDLVDLVSFIRLEKFDNIENLVNSSTELHFRPSTLVFGQSAEVDVNWNGEMRLCFDMVFCNAGVKVYFRLFICKAYAAVEIDYVEIAPNSQSGHDRPMGFEAALADAAVSTMPVGGAV